MKHPIEDVIATRGIIVEKTPLICRAKLQNLSFCAWNQCFALMFQGILALNNMSHWCSAQFLLTRVECHATHCFLNPPCLASFSQARFWQGPDSPDSGRFGRFGPRSGGPKVRGSGGRAETLPGRHGVQFPMQPGHRGGRWPGRRAEGPEGEVLVILQKFELFALPIFW